jgi:hypothetical protein
MFGLSLSLSLSLSFFCRSRFGLNKAAQSIDGTAFSPSNYHLLPRNAKKENTFGRILKSAHEKRNSAPISYRNKNERFNRPIRFKSHGF